MAKQDLRKSPNLDSVTTVNADGSHYILHPADVSGRFTTARKIFAAFLLLIYVALPWIQINGAPAVFLDVQTRQFHLFGITLAPQDLWVMFFSITGLGFSLFFITALLGRVWCGWACPYTVFLEHIYRRIERWIDGEGTQRKRLDAAPWGPGKIFRRVVKNGLFLIVSALLAHVFLSYFISIKRLYHFMEEGPMSHAFAFGAILFLTGALYVCFARFREQFCIMVCPYGRLQSAMTDDNTMIIGYDEMRGEPRGKPGAVTGDCVDCRRCVNVCPTGIDIRNGLQLECIGCAACIDACDDIMKKLDRPTGLVRYDSLNGLSQKKRQILRPRIFVYATLGFLGLAALTLTTFFKARPYTVSSSRMAGAPFYIDSESVRNHYQLRLLNKRNQPATFEMSLENPPAGYSLSGAGQVITIEPHKGVTRPTILKATAEGYKGPTELTLAIKGQPGDITLRHKIRFVGPHPDSLKTPAP
ncbi:MAG: cytochrome c oxidase accessory protein CcoG [Verrucomicrobiales bacterium]|nr:cytochrome c oxidase accessory protein CcoG [Verrucomicrobiales bacterium]